MVSMKERGDQLVLPGDRVGVVEEFSPGQGSFETMGGIYSKVVGLTSLDLRSRTMNVKPLVRRTLMPKVGDVVVCEVTSTSEKVATVRIIRGAGRFFNTPFTGLIYTTTVGMRYLRNLYEALKPRDIVLAQVVSTKNGVYHLSTQERELGVLLSYCSQCGSTLRREGNFMRCRNCGNVEKRKYSIFYGRSDLDYDRVRLRPPVRR